MAASTSQTGPLSAVALFPLPNVVLFPRAVLPLHIFEERYKAMTARLLSGSGRLAMALLKPGWEKDYYGRPEIEPIVCVGTILNYETLPDGTYNFLLQGHTRAKIVREHDHHPYRIAELEPLEEVLPPEAELHAYRQRFMSIFDNGSLLATVIGRQFRQLLSTALSTAEISDLIAFNFLDDIALKHSLLCECDVLRRISRTVAAFEAIRAPLKPVSTMPGKPSMN
ncbi:MAG TPA: LON peptidase substrate-binding domain-containing protein [Tepidisphaeraceae bacterium]|jgi:hypothetical protein|nr:LON peptidase substrate-binding domain-containing protein [Tepidisphaeraceae bacterium]